MIRRIRRLLRGRTGHVKVGIGDDCLVLRDGTVVTIDSFVEGIHFDLAYFDFRALGHRLMAGTLSDLAAMAARPLVSVVSLLLPPRVRARQVEDFYRGARRLAGKFDCPIAGGDTDRAPVFAVSIAALGRATNPILRSAARPGDLLYLTGYPGLSEAGRLVLKNHLKKSQFPRAIEKHLRPVPRIREAYGLRRFIRAMIDTSDGLSTDAYHLAEESKVKIIIKREAIPVHREVHRIIERLHLDQDRFILSSGEDFELLFSSPAVLPGRIGNARLGPIGHIEAGQGVFITRQGRPVRLEITGYDHFREIYVTQH